MRSSSSSSWKEEYFCYGVIYFQLAEDIDIDMRRPSCRLFVDVKLFERSRNPATK
jgi:hypothetical protein